MNKLTFLQILPLLVLGSVLVAADRGKQIVSQPNPPMAKAFDLL
ncbi:hypothetical protein N8615_01580 [Verrucomicrobiales bacterium]|nr:hypothetical protein [Verrucomicrobiales bacterium]